MAAIPHCRFHALRSGAGRASMNANSGNRGSLRSNAGPIDYGRVREHDDSSRCAIPPAAARTPTTTLDAKVGQQSALVPRLRPRSAVSQVNTSKSTAAPGEMGRRPISHNAAFRKVGPVVTLRSTWWADLAEQALCLAPLRVCQAIMCALRAHQAVSPTA